MLALLQCMRPLPRKQMVSSLQSSAVVGGRAQLCSAQVVGEDADAGTIQPVRPSVPLISAAPMMAVTNRHWRYMARKLTCHTQLYTEMLVDKAITMNNSKKGISLVQGFPGELPEDGLCTRLPRSEWSNKGAREAMVGVILDEMANNGVSGVGASAVGGGLTDETPHSVVQLGGGVGEEVAAATRFCVASGFKIINLNCGCPSQKLVKHTSDRSRFGAILMTEPERTREILQAAQAAVTVDGLQLADITVKCRIGVGQDESYGMVDRFVKMCHESGIRHMIVHCRNALLDGKASPKANRKIPPLRYEVAYQLMDDYPDVAFTINGGIDSMASAAEHLARGASGVMLGRAFMHNPWLLQSVDSEILGKPQRAVSRVQVCREFAHYAADAYEESKETWVQSERALVAPLLGLFNEQMGASQFRNAIERGFRGAAAKLPKARRKGKAKRAHEPPPSKAVSVVAGALGTLRPPASDS